MRQKSIGNLLLIPCKVSLEVTCVGGKVVKRLTRGKQEIKITNHDGLGDGEGILVLENGAGLFSCGSDWPHH